MYVFLKCNLLFNAGICKTEEDERPSTEDESQSFSGEGVCKWFNVRMGFGFLSMTSREGVPLDEPVDVFVHQVRKTTNIYALRFLDARVRPVRVCMCVLK